MKIRNQTLVFNALLKELGLEYRRWFQSRRRRCGEHQRDLFLWDVLKQPKKYAGLEHLLRQFEKESELPELWTAWRCKTIADDLLGPVTWDPEVIWAVWSLVFPGGPVYLYDPEEDPEAVEALEGDDSISAVAQVLATAFVEDELMARDESRFALLARYGVKAEAADRDRLGAPRDLCEHRAKWLDSWSDQVARTLGEYLPDETRRLEWKHQEGLSFYMGQAVRQIFGDLSRIHHSFDWKGGWPEEIEDVLESEIIALVEGFNEKEG